MVREVYDAAVIGSGPGGEVAAIRAAQLGLKTVCIEKDPALGGTCLNVGCIPSKALLQSSEYYALMNHEAKDHGLLIKDLSYDFKKMQERKNQIVHGLGNGIGGLFKNKGVSVCKGTAKFLSPNVVAVTDGKNVQEIEAKSFILATGSEPIPLPFLPFDEKVVLSSTGALALEAPPKKMVVIGAGVIGVELASVYNRLGSEVVIVEMLDRICPANDLAISKMLLQIVRKQGITFHLGAKVTGGKVEKNQASITVEIEGKAQQFAGDVVLVAVGRRPYSKGLGLPDIGVSINGKGYVAVEGNFQTNIPHIYAIGDLIEGPMLAHRASEEGIAVAEIIAGQSPYINYMAIPNIVYTHPEVAALGLTEQEAVGKGIKVKTGICYFRANARARCLGYTEGMVKVIGEENSKRLIGMHIIGPWASELIAEGVMAIEKRSTLEDIARASHAHPTLSEAIHEACLVALGRPIYT